MSTKTAQHNEIMCKYIIVLAYRGKWPYDTIVCTTSVHASPVTVWTSEQIFHEAWKQEDAVESGLNADTMYQEVNNIILMWLLWK